MSTKTKNINISPNSKRIVDELETTEDLYRGLAEYERQMKLDDKRKRKRLATQFAEIGNEMVENIQEKQKTKEEKRIEIIERIYNLSGDKFVSVKEANELTIEELKPILFNAENINKPWYVKLFDLLMGN